MPGFFIDSISIASWPDLFRPTILFSVAFKGGLAGTSPAMTWNGCASRQDSEWQAIAASAQHMYPVADAYRAAGQNIRIDPAIGVIFGAQEIARNG